MQPDPVPDGDFSFCHVLRPVGARQPVGRRNATRIRAIGDGEGMLEQFLLVDDRLHGTNALANGQKPGFS